MGEHSAGGHGSSRWVPTVWRQRIRVVVCGLHTPSGWHLDLGVFGSGRCASRPVSLLLSSHCGLGDTCTNLLVTQIYRLLKCPISDLVVHLRHARFLAGACCFKRPLKATLASCCSHSCSPHVFFPWLLIFSSAPFLVVTVLSPVSEYSIQVVVHELISNINSAVYKNDATESELTSNKQLRGPC